MRIFLFGAGYSTRAFAAANGGQAETIIGTTRSPEKFGLLRNAAIGPVLFDGAISGDVRNALASTTHLIISAAPGEGGDPALSALGYNAQALLPALQWIGYLSTVGVYGDHQGEWIDERAEPRPKSRRSVLRLEAEQAWTRQAQALHLPLSILRLSGIYGPGRNAFVNLESGTARRLVKPGQVFNRIHVADIAGALWHLASKRRDGIFNVTDDLPAPPQDVVEEAARIMGVPVPPEQDFATATLTPMQRSFYGENKRVSNARLIGSGYAFSCPDYHSGLTQLWAGDWRGSTEHDGRTPISN